jgi:hypothetical protein
MILYLSLLSSSSSSSCCGRGAFRETSRALDEHFLVGTAALQLLAPLYLLGCPSNFFHAMGVWGYGVRAGQGVQAHGGEGGAGAMPQRRRRAVLCCATLRQTMTRFVSGRRDGSRRLAAAAAAFVFLSLSLVAALCVCALRLQLPSQPDMWICALLVLWTGAQVQCRVQCRGWSALLCNALHSLPFPVISPICSVVLRPTLPRLVLQPPCNRPVTPCNAL